jgi:ATP-dependent Clp protease ATP-binding subunit ClpC
MDKGFDPAFGARPLKRALQRYIEDPMAEEILRNKFTEESAIVIKLDKKRESLKFVEGNPKKKGKVSTQEEQNANVS